MLHLAPSVPDSSKGFSKKTQRPSTYSRACHNNSGSQQQQQSLATTATAVDVQPRLPQQQRITTTTDHNNSRSQQQQRITTTARLDVVKRIDHEVEIAPEVWAKDRLRLRRYAVLRKYAEIFAEIIAEIIAEIYLPASAWL